MKKILALAFLALFISINTLKAQSCFNVAAGNDTTISCLQPCMNLKARVPDVRTTDNYTVVPIPYAPLPFTSPLGTELTLLYQDDKFSDSITLPFTFCFYGQSYTKVSIGSNGVFTFDVSTNATQDESYVLAPGDTIHYAGGAPGNIGVFYAPRASIFLAYFDMDPRPGFSPPERKIEYRLEGTAPCRKLVISYYHVDTYHGEVPGTGACLNKLATMQAVLYEGTGLIDVFYETKPSCPSWESGLAIAGLQNWNQDQHVSPPGRNGTVWTAVREAYRYIPSGVGSLLKRVELYKNGVLVPVTVTTTPLGNGELEATFTNVCQSEDSMSYVVRAFYQQCDNPAIETEGSDTIIVYKTLNPLTVNTSPAACPTSGNGQITVVSPVGANIEYSIDGGATWQTSPVFNVPAGSYTVIARVIGSTCTGTAPAVITSSPPFSINGVVTDVKCKGQSTGQVTFNPIGNTPFDYSKDGGATYQASNIFAGLPAGTYTFRVRNGLGCTQDTTLIISEPATVLSASSASTTASCPNNDGTITISAGGGTPGYQYSIDNGANYQAGNVFSNLPAGNYNNIKIKDANGCIANSSAVVPLTDTMRLELGPDSTICFGSSLILLPQTNAATDTFKWTPGAGLDHDTAKNPVASPSDTTKYYLLAKWGTCQRTDSITINVLHKPVAHAGNDTTICYKSTATLNGWATNLSGTVNYAWTPPDSLNTPNAASTIVRTDTTRQFTLTVTDNYGCNFSVSDSIWIFMQPVVPAFAGNDTNAMAHKPHQLYGSGGGPGGTYLWSPAGPLDNPFIQNPKAVLSNDTYFNLLVTDAIGCTAEDGVFIKVYEGPEYYVPNAFTPNGDGLNDIFRPIPAGMTTPEYFRVFNRSGQLVFQTSRWMEGWDGKFKGKDAQQGTYVWMIKGRDVNGSVVQMQGTVILLR